MFPVLRSRLLIYGKGEGKGYFVVIRADLW